MSTTAKIAVALVVICAAGAPVTTAMGAVATFTPTADDSIFNINGLEYNNEGGLYFTTVGQIGPFGDVPPIYWNGRGMDQRFLTRFDVSSLGGIADLHVDSVTLRLFSAGVDAFWTSGSTLNIEAHPVTDANRDWVEGPGDVTHGGDGLVVVPGTASWNAKVTGLDQASNPYAAESWAGSPGLNTPDVDYNTALMATRSLQKTDLQFVGTPIDFTFSGTSAQLTALINSWLVDNYTLHQDNPGLLLFNPVDGDPTASDLNQRALFYSRDECTMFFGAPVPDPSWVPQLVVSYSQAPEPGTIVLLAAGLAAWAVQLSRVRRKRDTFV